MQLNESKDRCDAALGSGMTQQTRLIGHSLMGMLSVPGAQGNTAGNAHNHCRSEGKCAIGIAHRCSSAAVQHKQPLDPTEKQHHVL